MRHQSTSLYAGPWIYFSILTFLILFINDEKLES